MKSLCLALVVVWLLPALGRARDHERVVTHEGLPLVRVASGRYEPLYPEPKQSKVRVPAFLMMTRLVTNADFHAFVLAHPEYRRDRIARIFADASYLTHWSAPTELGAQARPLQPVTRVSWFAAKAFCESHGLRLPDEAEWEFAAAASEKRKNGRSEPTFRARLLEWYSQPNKTLPDVPRGPQNFYGISDLHGVVWEWVMDFNNTRVVSDSRSGGDAARGQFCGGGAALASDSMDYAAFMRLAMRSSLSASFAVANLGFRCAADEHAFEGNTP